MIGKTMVMIVLLAVHGVASASEVTWQKAQKVINEAAADAIVIPPDRVNPVLGVKLMGINLENLSQEQAMKTWRSVARSIEQMYGAAAPTLVESEITAKLRRVEEVDQSVAQMAQAQPQKEEPRINGPTHTGPLYASTSQQRESSYENNQSLSIQVPVGPRSLADLQRMLEEAERKAEKFR